MPGTVLEKTPQRIGNGRVTIGKKRRAKLIAAQVNAAIDAHVAHAAHELNQITGQQILAACETQLGKPYCAYGCRCEVYCDCHDCSGLPCFAMNLLGLPHICTSSFGFAALGQSLGLQVTFEYAFSHPGCVLIRNPFGSSNMNGSNGHIVVTEGDGTDATVEEKGRAYGCVRDHANGRGFTYAMKLPGVNHDGIIVPTKPKVEPMLILDTKHAGKPNRTRSVSIDAAGNIFQGNGAKLAGEGVHKVVNGVHVVIPPLNGAPFMGAAASGGGFTIQALQKDGSFADFHYEFVS